MSENHYTLEHLDQTATPCTRCGVEIRFCLAGFRNGQPLCHRCFRLEKTDLAPMLGLIGTILMRGVDLLVPGEDCAMAFKKKPSSTQACSPTRFETTPGRPPAEIH